MKTPYRSIDGLEAWLFDQGGNGVLVRSARRGGSWGATLREDRLSKVRDRMYLTYRCNPTQDHCAVERDPGDVWMEISTSSLY